MAGRSAAALPLLLILAWARSLAADEDTSVVFWLGADPTDVFPRALVEERGISLENLDPLPVHCAAPHEPDPALEEKIGEGIDLFYSNDFEASESILRDVWLEMGKGTDVLDIPPSWITTCLAFRMLMFKAVDKGPEAEALAREAAGRVHPSFLGQLDIPPDGRAFIVEKLEEAALQGHAVEISTPQDREACSLWVDGVRQPAVASRLSLADGVHWIRAACGGAEGWTWRVELPLQEGRTFYLDPEIESQCACGAFPLVVCSDPKAEVLAMASNLLLCPQVRSCFVLKGGSGEVGVFLSGEITPTGKEPGDLHGLSWERLDEPPPVTPEPAGHGGKPKGKPGLHVPALVLAVAGSGMAVVSTGLGAGSLSAAGSAYTEKDPWARAEKVAESTRLEKAALVTAGLAASLLVTSLIYHIVVYRKHKLSEKSK